MMSPLCSRAVGRGTLFAGLILTLSPMAFADRHADAYAGRFRCSDKMVTDVREAYFDTFKPVLLRRLGGPKSSVNAFTLGTAKTGKFYWGSSREVWYQTLKAAGAAGPTSFSIEKTGDGSAAVNVLVCSFEFVPDEKRPQTPDSKRSVAMVNEAAIRIPHDAPVGTKVPLLVSSTKDKAIVYVVYMRSESGFRSFPYSLTTALPTASK